MTLHKALATDDIHSPYRRLWADAAARAADTGPYTAADVTNRVKGLQTDTLAEYVLTATTPTWTPLPTGGGGVGSTIFLWRFSTSTTAADPGSGRFRFDNATPASVTNIYLDSVTQGGLTLDNFLADLSIGEEIGIQQGDDAGKIIVVEISGAPVNNTGWWTIPVTVISTVGTLFGNNKDCAFVFHGDAPDSDSALPPGYVDGCLASWTNATTVAVAAGNLRDDTNMNNIVVTTTRSADITTTGAGGRNVDTAEVADKWYAVFVIADSAGVEAEAAFLVNEDDLGSFTMPTDYDLKRRVGWVRNDGSSNLREFSMRGSGRDRHAGYSAQDRDDLVVFSNQEPIIWTSADASEFIPPTSRLGEMDFEIDQGTDDYTEVRPTGSGIANAQGRRIEPAVSSGFSIQHLSLGVDSSQTFDYRRSDVTGNGVTLYVYGYEDDL